MIEPADTTIQAALREATRRLEQAGIDTPRLDAEVLLRHALQIDRTQLFLRYPDPLPEADREAFATLLAERERHVPVAYLTGAREFMGLSFQTTPSVLIPRPDTEPLVEWALDWLRSHPQATVVDIGTGSGAIAVSIAAHVSDTFTGTIIATDVSPDALAIAEANARQALSSERFDGMEFRLGSLTAPVHDQRIDLLITNLPYLRPDQITTNPDLDHEPRLALYGGSEGLDLINRVIDDLPLVLNKGGTAGFEIDPAQAEKVVARLRTHFPDASVRIVRDLAQFSRHVVVERPSDGQ